jgi:hypothetical protein
VPDLTLSTLAQIRIKVRRLTRSPSVTQLSTQQIDDYINTFILYDFPEITVDTTLVFYTHPNIDVYETNTFNLTDPLYNFKNVYLSVKPPIYLAGQEIPISQSSEEFFRSFPKYVQSQDIGVGDGLVNGWAGTLNTFPILPDSITFSSVDVNNAALILKDVPQINPVTGVIENVGEIVTPDSLVHMGNINYETGQYIIAFPAAPDVGALVISQFTPYVPGKPIAVLYEDNKFTFRPVPDKTYRVEIGAFKRPSELLAAHLMPDLAQWWQYIAYGASKKIFEDRMDVESVDAITPEFSRQRALVLQKMVVQQSTQRTSTIYSENGYSMFFNKI